MMSPVRGPSLPSGLTAAPLAGPVDARVTAAMA